MGMINKENNNLLKKENFNEYFIQTVLEKYYMSNPKYVIFNLHVFEWESDFLLFTRAGYCYEVEIKISYADFKNDFKHKTEKYHILENGTRKLIGRGIRKESLGQNIFDEAPSLRPNYFSYCVPYYLVDRIKPLLPPYAGLCYVNKYGRLEFVRGGRQLHKNKLSEDDLNLKEKFYYAYNKWWKASRSWRTEILKLRYQISSLKAEYKALTGDSISDIL